MALLKNLVQVRDLQLVAVTSQLTQYLPSNGEIKAELPAVEGMGNVEQSLLQQPTLQALEALQMSRLQEAVQVHYLLPLLPLSAGDTLRMALLTLCFLGAGRGCTRSRRPIVHRHRVPCASCPPPHQQPCLGCAAAAALTAACS